MFKKFDKIPRLFRGMVISEKIDGTNGQICITPACDIDPESVLQIEDVGWSKSIGGTMYWMSAGSRNRWVSLENDNYGFARWVDDNVDELFTLGPGRHFGEWWGQGIQRRYGMDRKVFSLFNTARWDSSTTDRTPPECCSVVPVLYTGDFDVNKIKEHLQALKDFGSIAAPKFMDPEGVVIYLQAARQLFKATLDGNDAGKWELD